MCIRDSRKVERFLSQPFFVAEAFTGTGGKYVSIEDTVRSFKEIVEGEHDDLPERAFYMKGGIDEVGENEKKSGRKEKKKDEEEPEAEAETEEQETDEQETEQQEDESSGDGDGEDGEG